MDSRGRRRGRPRSPSTSGRLAASPPTPACLAFGPQLPGHSGAGAPTPREHVVSPRGRKSRSRAASPPLRRPAPAPRVPGSLVGLSGFPVGCEPRGACGPADAVRRLLKGRCSDSETRRASPRGNPTPGRRRTPETHSDLRRGPNTTARLTCAEPSQRARPRTSCPAHARAGRCTAPPSARAGRDWPARHERGRLLARAPSRAT